MRVCFLTHYFPPEAGAPQTRIDLLARTLAARGIQVTVHTGFPHYPAGTIPAPYHNRPWLRERRDGIAIVRSAVYPAVNRGFARRLADHAALAASALATAPLSGPADVVVGETPPLFTAAAGVAYAALKRAAYVVNVADRWPASAVEMGALSNRSAIAAASALERFTYEHADLITAPTAGIVTALAAAPEAGAKARRHVAGRRRGPLRPRASRAVPWAAAARCTPGRWGWPRVWTCSCGPPSWPAPTSFRPRSPATAPRPSRCEPWCAPNGWPTSI